MSPADLNLWATKISKLQNNSGKNWKTKTSTTNDRIYAKNAVCWLRTSWKVKYNFSGLNNKTLQIPLCAVLEAVTTDIFFISLSVGKSQFEKTLKLSKNEDYNTFVIFEQKQS